jgi:hypothetical protein
MGKINVKIANNYAPTPQQAADQYAQQNRTNNFMFPPVKQWIANPNIDLMHGFGMAAELADGSAIVGLSVCHLKNQQTGVEQLLTKTMDILEKEGKITADERSNFNLAIKREVDGSALINQLFIDAAIYTTDRMNKIGNSDIDFSYQFNPSAVQGLEPKFTNLIGGLGFKNAGLGATMPSVASGSTETEYTSPIGSSDEYVLPGWYGILRSYVRGNVQSFFQADSTYQEIGGGGNSEDVAKALDAVFNEQSDAIANCTDKQATLYEEQQQAIEERTQKLAEEIEAARKAAEEAAKKASAPSIPSDAFNIDESGEVSKWWPAYLKYQGDNRPEASDIRKDLDKALGLDGTGSIMEHYNASEDEDERYAVIGNTILNEPQAMTAAKIIKEFFSQA